MTVDDQMGKIDGCTCNDVYGHQCNVSFECRHTRNKAIDGLKKRIFHQNCFYRFKPFCHAHRKIIMAKEKSSFPIDFSLNQIISLEDFNSSCNGL